MCVCFCERERGRKKGKKKGVEQTSLSPEGTPSSSHNKRTLSTDRIRPGRGWPRLAFSCLVLLPQVWVSSSGCLCCPFKSWALVSPHPCGPEGQDQLEVSE